MGSLMGQSFIADHGAALAGAILSGSNGRPPAIAALGGLVARFERWRLGPRGKSALLKQMMFGEFNKPFRPARTQFDWLSRDPAQVDAYVADPLCGFDFTTQLAIDLLGGLPPLLAPETLARIPKRLPIYVMSGARDPVGANLQSLIDAYRGAGLTTTVRLYPDARHELLNETNREEVKAALIAWIDGVLAKSGGRLTAVICRPAIAAPSATRPRRGRRSDASARRAVATSPCFPRRGKAAHCHAARARLFGHGAHKRRDAPRCTTGNRKSTRRSPSPMG